MGIRKPSPKLTDPGTEVIALPAVIKKRLDMLKGKNEPYYALIERLLDFYVDEHLLGD